MSANQIGYFLRGALPKIWTLHKTSNKKNVAAMSPLTSLTENCGIVKRGEGDEAFNITQVTCSKLL